MNGEGEGEAKGREMERGGGNSERQGEMRRGRVK